MAKNIQTAREIKKKSDLDGVASGEVVYVAAKGGGRGVFVELIKNLFDGDSIMVIKRDTKVPIGGKFILEIFYRFGKEGKLNNTSSYNVINPSFHKDEYCKYDQMLMRREL